MTRLDRKPGIDRDAVAAHGLPTSVGPGAVGQGPGGARCGEATDKPVAAGALASLCVARGDQFEVPWTPDARPPEVDADADRLEVPLSVRAHRARFAGLVARRRDPAAAESQLRWAHAWVARLLPVVA